MPNNLRVTIDPARCVGYGRCASIATGVFMIDADTAKAYADDDVVGDAPAAIVFAAARACPTQAISIEQFGNRIYPRVIEPMPADIQQQLQLLERADET